MLPAIPPAAQQPLPQNGTPDPSMPFNLDPYTAKQMALLQATSLAKAGNRSAPGGTSASYFGGMSLNNSSRPDSSSPQDMNAAPAPGGLPNFQGQSQQPSSPQATLMNAAAMQQSQHQRKRSFLNGMANIMMQRRMPLPPALTGMQTPGYDPNTSPWRSLEINPTELGTIRIAGRDVDLYKLWALVLQVGGGQKLTMQNMWGQLLPHLDLPEQYTQPNGQLQMTAMALQNHYNMLVAPFEEVYRKNFQQQQQQRAMMASRVAPGTSQLPSQPGMSGSFSQLQRTPSHPNIGMTGMAPPIPVSQQPVPTGINGMNSAAGQSMVPLNSTDSVAGSSNAPGFLATGNADLNNGDVDQESGKRKLRDSEEMDGKRVRQKTSGSDSSDPRSSVGPGVIAPLIGGHATNMASRTVRQPSRRKIEYVPLAREVDTAGGRDMEALQHEYAVAVQRTVRNIDDWGTVDIDALTMSIRSRISTELSYALTTFTILTLMRSPNKDAGFPISQAADLLDEVLDLVEDVAFDGRDDGDSGDDSKHSIITHRELLNSLLDSDSQPFAALDKRQGIRESKLGHRQRPGDLILMVLNIFRNLTVTSENQEYMAKHDKFMGVVLRLCMLKSPVEGAAQPAAASPALSLSDLVAVRKEIVQILVNVASNVQLASDFPPSDDSLRNARRAFELLASYVMDPSDPVTPFACMLQSGTPTQMFSPKPASTVDAALEAFARLAQPDDNRQVFSIAVPKEWMWSMFEALVHRLPISDQDFGVIMREAWLAYFERIMLSSYSLAFLAPPEVKKRIKGDRKLGYPKIMLRLIKKLTSTPAELRHHFMISVRRAIETMKLVDDAEDSFDTSQAVMPTLTFGMGYGEHGEAREERGMGLLSGYQDEITWGVMLQRELDDLMFNELSSLVRIG
ncbi:hypothetical protein ABKN59_001121 [Abortiporus biennis]